MRLLLTALAYGLVLAACGSDPTTAVSGTLATGDETLETGEFMDAYTVVAREGQWTKVEVLSGDFDPYVMVISPTDVQTEVDDSSLDNTSMTKAILEVDEGGEWTVIVTSFAPGEAGSYEVSYGALDEEPPDADEGTQVGLEDEPAITV